MKNLYLKYIDMKNMGQQMLPGTLDVSDTGRRFNLMYPIQVEGLT